MEKNQQEKWAEFIEKQGDQVIFSGSILLTIGTLISALALTEVFITRSPRGAEGIVIGNAVEAVGNSVQAIGNEKLFSIKPIAPRRTIITGSWFEAIGNTGNAIAVQEGINLYRFTFTDRGSRRDRANAGEILEEERTGASRAQEEGVDEALKQAIAADALSSGIQSLGAFMEASGISQLEPYNTQQAEYTGTILIGIGSIIEVLGALLALREEELRGVFTQMIGAWTQFAGSLIETEGFIRSFSITEKKETNENGNYSYSSYT